MFAVAYVYPLIFATAVQQVVAQNQLTICHRLVLLPDRLVPDRHPLPPGEHDNK